MADKVIHTCICTKGALKERLDTFSENPFYFDCETCLEFFKIEDGRVKIIPHSIKVGQVKEFRDIKHINLFLYAFEKQLSFFDTQLIINDNGSCSLKILRIIK